MTIFSKAMKARITSRLLGCLLLCLPGLVATGVAQVTRTIGQGIITTFAGNNTTGDTAAAPAGPATQDAIGFPSAMVTDASGNVYFADTSPSGAVWLVYEGVTVPPLLQKLVAPPYVKGYAYGIVNVNNVSCPPNSACGDTGAATLAFLNSPLGLALDTSGSLYIADSGSQAIRKVDASTGNISTIAGDALHMSAGYGGDNGPAISATLSYPDSVAFDGSGNLYVSDSGNLIIRKIDQNGNITTVAGTVPVGGAAVGCTVAPCGDNGPATTAQFGYVFSIFVDSDGDIYASDTSAETIRRIDHTSKTITTVAGTLSPTQVVCDPPSCGDGGLATSALLNSPYASYLDSQGNLYIADYADNAVRVVDTVGKIHTVVGQLSTTFGYTGDSGPAIQATLYNPSSIAVDSSGRLYVADEDNNVIRLVTPLPPLPPQTITFTPPLTATYGQSPIDLSADAKSSSGLVVTFSVSGPGTITGSTLTITGAGNIVVTANQAGNSAYAPATPVSQTIVVAAATLTVTAQNYPLKGGTPIPANLPYTITGYVSPDTQTGAPLLQVENPATQMPFPAGSTPAPGSYTVAISQGSLPTNANYAFTFVNGTLTDTLGLTQTLAFGSYTPPTVYGGANSTFTFSVTTNAGAPSVSVTVTGPIVLQPLPPSTWSAKVIGAGPVTLTAAQAGNYSYLPATATSQFVVSPATLTVPLSNATRPYGASNPAFSYGPPAGFLGTDNSSLLSGAPSYTTSATQASDPGNYDLNASPGTLYAPNYTFVFTKATLTITQATQQITNFTAPATVVFGGSGYPLPATASSNLPLVYTSTGPVQISSGGTTFQATGVGPATITATQAGNADYAPVSSTISFNVAPATQYVSAAAVSIPFGAAIPPLNWCFASIDATTGLPACDSSINLAANLYSGAPAVATTAAQGSITGPYPITVSAGTLTSSDYSFVYAPGTLTITPASTYILSANPSSITLSPGQSGQSTITLTPINNYVGTVTIACSGLPVGVTCQVAPAGLTTSLNSQGIAGPLSAMLTISASKVVAKNTIGGTSGMLAAGMLGLPGLFAGILIFYRRAQFNQRSIFTGILFLVALGASTIFVAACGGGSSHSGGAQPGTTQIMVTGSGAASAGAVSQSVGLTVTIQ